MIHDYLPIGLLMVIALTLALVLAKASEWFGPKKPTDTKLSTYESGMEPVRGAHERFSVKFYVVAMLFIVFDIETVFLYPWAVNVRDLGLFGFVEMLVFIGILMLGFVYVLKKGAFDWD
jgi:NADH-quinone oxidoreductase subunit A